MKSFLVFVSIVLLVYGTINYYLYRRIIQAAALEGTWLWVLKVIIILAVLSFPLGRTLGGSSIFGSIFNWVGAFWLGVMVYGLLAVILFDFAKIIDILTGWMPDALLAERILTGRLMLLASVVTIGMFLLSGMINSHHPQVSEVNIVMEKLPADREEYSIAVFADTHLGALVGEERLEKIVSIVNGIAPDMCLIIGDLVDENPGRLGWIEGQLKNIQAVDGVYAVTGNHEFYAGVEACAELMQRAGIKLLRDTLVTVNGTVNIAGIDDRTGRKQYDDSGRSIRDVLADADESLPTILMHHTPVRKTEAQLAGVDLMLCGHTHGGQLWPFGYITKLVYKIGQGLTRYGDMDIYLTNGAGTWGPPVRLAAKPEIVHLLLTSKPVE